VTCDPKNDEELHGGRLVVANTHGVNLLQTGRQIVSHLRVIAIQRLDISDTRQTQFALLDVTVCQNHAEEEQIGRGLRHELHPRRVEQLTHLQAEHATRIMRFSTPFRRHHKEEEDFA